MIDLLHITNMQDCKPIFTPMAATDRLSREGGTTLAEAEVFQYHNTVGDLQYWALTRLDLSYSVNMVCQVLQAPTNLHWAVVKRILRYVKETLNSGL